MDKDLQSPYYQDLKIDFYIILAILATYVIPALIITSIYRLDCVFKFNIVVYTVSVVAALVICTLLYFYDQENDFILIILRCVSQFIGYIIGVSHNIFVFEIWTAYATLTSLDYSSQHIQFERIKILKILVIVFQLLITVVICGFLLIRYLGDEEDTEFTMVREIIFLAVKCAKYLIDIFMLIKFASLMRFFINSKEYKLEEQGKKLTCCNWMTITFIWILFVLNILESTFKCFASAISYWINNELSFDVNLFFFEFQSYSAIVYLDSIGILYLAVCLGSHQNRLQKQKVEEDQDSDSSRKNYNTQSIEQILKARDYSKMALADKTMQSSLQRDSDDEDNETNEGDVNDEINEESYLQIEKRANSTVFQQFLASQAFNIPPDVYVSKYQRQFMKRSRHSNQEHQ